jgi:hypothetical protein
MAVKNRKVAAKGGCATYTERLYGDLLIVTTSELLRGKQLDAPRSSAAAAGAMKTSKRFR